MSFRTTCRQLFWPTSTSSGGNISVPSGGGTGRGTLPSGGNISVQNIRQVAPVLSPLIDGISAFLPRSRYKKLAGFLRELWPDKTTRPWIIGPDGAISSAIPVHFRLIFRSFRLIFCGKWHREPRREVSPRVFAGEPWCG